MGHLDWVKQIQETAAGLPGLAVRGSLYDGVGVCMPTARKAADQVRTWLSNNKKEDGTS